MGKPWREHCSLIKGYVFFRRYNLFWRLLRLREPLFLTKKSFVVEFQKSGKQLLSCVLGQNRVSCSLFSFSIFIFFLGFHFFIFIIIFVIFPILSPPSAKVLWPWRSTWRLSAADCVWSCSNFYQNCWRSSSAWSTQSDNFFTQSAVHWTSDQLYR